MLVRHSILQFVSFFGMITLLNTPLVFGQGPMMDPNQYYGGQQFVAPESYQNPQAFYPPGNPQLQPYPGIDMYRWDKQQTSIQDGVWMQQFFPSDTTYTSSFEYIQVFFDDPRGITWGYGGGFDSLAASAGGFFDISDFAPRTNANSNFTNGTAHQLAGYGTRPLDLGKAYPNDVQRPGFRVTFGAEQSDGAKIEVNGFWSENRTETVFFGQDPSYYSGDPTLLGQTPIQGGVPIAGILNVTDLLNAGNPTITLDAGNGVPTIVPFDEFYQLDWNSQVWGTGVTVLRAPIIERDSFRVRPMLGARYVRLTESYGFVGQDSGADYAFAVQAGTTNIDPIGGSNLGGIRPGEPTGVIDFFGPGDLNIARGEPVPQYRMEINSQSAASLAGPEIGLRLDAGEGRFMKAWIQSSVGLLVNQDKQKLRGYGVGNYFIDNDGNGIVDGLEGPAANPVFNTPDNGLRTNRFEDTKSHTTISPMFELGGNLEFDILKHIPLINKLEISDNTIFRTGYTFTYISNVVRPNENIDFLAYPNVPKINGERSRWSMQTLSFALETSF